MHEVTAEAFHNLHMKATSGDDSVLNILTFHACRKLARFAVYPLF